MPVTVEMLDAAFVEVGDHLSGRPIPRLAADFTLADKQRAKADVALTEVGICPSVCPGPGHTEPVFCDRDVDPATGEHLDGTKTHRGHVKPGGAPATAWRGSNNDWYWG